MRNLYKTLAKPHHLLPWFIIFLFAISTEGYAQQKVLAVISHKTAIYDNFYDTLKSTSSNPTRIEKIYIDHLHEKDLNNYDAVISIGSAASEVLSRTPGINRLIYTLIPDSLSEAISQRPCIAIMCQAVLIEQPLERYFRLFNLIFPGTRNLVIATTPASSTDISTLTSTAKKNGIKLKIINVPRNEVVARTLINKLSMNDVLLALPDPYIYNRDTAKSIILSSYHKNVPIIAYSQAFAKAGALISLYSSFEDIANQTVQLIESTDNNQFRYNPAQFSIEVNSSVSDSLDIDMDNIELIKGAIR